MKKIILLILLLVLFTPIKVVLADEVDYNLEFKNQRLYETITYKIYDYQKIENGGSIGDIIIDGNKKTFYNNDNIVYEKTISQNGNNYIIILKYAYKNTEILNSRIIRNCFQNREIYSTDEHLEFKSIGRFNCLNTEKISIRITSDMKIEANGNKEGNAYTWELNEKNIDNPNIKIKLYKNSLGKEPIDVEDNNEEKRQSITIMDKIKDNIIYIIGGIVFLLVGIIAFVITSKKQNKY